MTDRDRLIELYRNAKAAMKAENLSCDLARNGFVADFLIANGVTVQEWISVKDRLPENVAQILACTITPHRKGRPFKPFVGDANTVQRMNEKSYIWCGSWRAFTHWMPLPQPPKGD